MVRRLELHGLPRVSGRSCDLTLTGAARLGALPAEVTITIPPFGATTLMCSGVTTPSPPDQMDAVWQLSLDSAPGKAAFLILPSLGALRLIAATLGLRSPRIPRHLGTAERGVVATTIARVLRATARDLSLTLALPRWQPEGLVRLRITADLGGFIEKALLDVPLEWLPDRTGPTLVADLKRRRLGVPVALELARTTLTIYDWSRVRCGDAVVADEVTAPPPDSDWTIRVVCGQFAAQARLSPDGQVALATAFEAVGTSNRNIQDRTSRRRNNMQNNSQSASLAVLASAPIEVVAEIGRVILRADEVAALGPGSILPFGALRPTTVDLRVGDRIWAQGELVDVDGHLGVRVTTVAPGTDARVSSDEADTVR